MAGNRLWSDRRWKMNIIYQLLINIHKKWEALRSESGRLVYFIWVSYVVRFTYIRAHFSALQNEFHVMKSNIKAVINTRYINGSIKLLNENCNLFKIEQYPSAFSLVQLILSFVYPCSHLHQSHHIINHTWKGRVFQFTRAKMRSGEKIFPRNIWTHRFLCYGKLHSIEVSGDDSVERQRLPHLKLVTFINRGRSATIVASWLLISSQLRFSHGSQTKQGNKFLNYFTCAKYCFPTSFSFWFRWK